MAAYLTSPSSPTDANWYPDTSSTNHFTNDFHNLTVHSEPYNGTNQIYVGDGAGLLVKNIGSATISTENKSFSLHQLLHVPQIKKKLIYVSQFTRDNNFYIEFHSSFFLVKDEAMGIVLLPRKNRDGLYTFPSTATPTRHPQTFISQRVPLDV